MSPADVTVPVKLGDALVANPRLTASVRSPNVSQPLFDPFLIFKRLLAVSAHIL